MTEPQSQTNDPLMGYEPWLRMLAKLEIDSRFAGKFSASDAVQQTMLEAWKNWDQFRGNEQHRQAWLRKILAFQLAKLARHYAGTQKRDVAKEHSIDVSLANSSLRVANLLVADQSSPSAQAMAHERSSHLAEVLEQLPEDYRQVILLRNLEGLSHAQVAERMQRNEGAVRMLWFRALAALRERLLSEP